MPGTAQEFLIEIQASQEVDCSALAAILVGRARAGDEATQLVAMRWLCEFVGQAKEQLLVHYASILAAVLPGLSHPNADVAVVGPQGLSTIFSSAWDCIWSRGLRSHNSSVASSTLNQATSCLLTASEVGPLFFAQETCHTGSWKCSASPLKTPTWGGPGHSGSICSLSC